MDMKQYKETYIKCKILEDLDLQEPFYTGDEPNDILFSNQVYSSTPSLEIDTVIKILEKYKTQGANRVYISSLVDHKGYVFDFVKLEEIS